MTESEPPALKRLRIPLDWVDADLLLVGEAFEEGARYVRAVVPRSLSEDWTWSDWDDQYKRLADELRAVPADRVRVS
jgi:hypothetical protein